MLRLALYSTITQRGDRSLRKVHMKHPPHHKSRTKHKIGENQSQASRYERGMDFFNFSS